MQVMAFSSPSQPRWRWRIVSNAGELIEESPQVFLSISTAVNEGRDRARELDIRDLSERSFAPRRGTSHLRS
jgi:hypothetical protein